MFRFNRAEASHQIYHKTEAEEINTAILISQSRSKQLLLLRLTSQIQAEIQQATRKREFLKPKPAPSQLWRNSRVLTTVRNSRNVSL